MTPKKVNNPYLKFYILIAYIVLQLVWWGYLLLQQNKDLAISNLKHANVDAVAVSAKEHKRALMIMGEGAVFVALLSIGAYYVIRGLRKEIELNQQQQNFLHSITHEMKTPITVNKLNAETLLNRALDEGKRKEILVQSIQELNRLTRLTENILTSASIDNSGFKAYFEKTNVSEILELSVLNAQKLYKDHEIEMDKFPSYYAMADKVLLPSLFFNIIENACKYSDIGSKIKIETQFTEGKLKVIIADSGPGINAIDKKKVFQKFYRSSHASNVKGTGLGLYISNQIALLHNASLTIEGNQPKGSKVIIELTLLN